MEGRHYNGVLHFCKWPPAVSVGGVSYLAVSSQKNEASKSASRTQTSDLWGLACRPGPHIVLRLNSCVLWMSSLISGLTHLLQTMWAALRHSECVSHTQHLTVSSVPLSSVQSCLCECESLCLGPFAVFSSSLCFLLVYLFLSVPDEMLDIRQLCVVALSSWVCLKNDNQWQCVAMHFSDSKAMCLCEAERTCAAVCWATFRFVNLVLLFFPSSVSFLLCSSFFFLNVTSLLAASAGMCCNPASPSLRCLSPLIVWLRLLRKVDLFTSGSSLLCKWLPTL